MQGYHQRLIGFGCRRREQNIIIAIVMQAQLRATDHQVRTNLPGFMHIYIVPRKPIFTPREQTNKEHASTNYTYYYGNQRPTRIKVRIAVFDVHLNPNYHYVLRADMYIKMNK